MLSLMSHRLPQDTICGIVTLLSLLIGWVSHVSVLLLLNHLLIGKLPLFPSGSLLWQKSLMPLTVQVLGILYLCHQMLSQLHVNGYTKSRPIQTGLFRGIKLILLLEVFSRLKGKITMRPLHQLPI